MRIPTDCSHLSTITTGASNSRWWAVTSPETQHHHWNAIKKDSVLFCRPVCLFFVAQLIAAHQMFIPCRKYDKEANLCEVKKTKQKGTKEQTRGSEKDLFGLCTRTVPTKAFWDLGVLVHLSAGLEISAVLQELQITNTSLYLNVDSIFMLSQMGFHPNPLSKKKPPKNKNKTRRISRGSSCVFKWFVLEGYTVQGWFLQVEQLTKQQSGGINDNERRNSNKTFQTEVIPQNIRMPDGNSTALRITTQRSPATTHSTSVSQAAL